MKKIILFNILFFPLINFSTSCTSEIPKSKDDCLNESNSYYRCCYNGKTNICLTSLTLFSNNLDDYYKFLKQENTNNIDCGLKAKDEINYCKRIIPYPTSNITA